MLQYYNYFKNYNHHGSASNNNNQFYSPIQGLSKGNMNPELYRDYDNYVQEELPYNQETELKAYNFAIIDLGLYLDIHPNDVNVKALYDQYVAKYQELSKQLEQQKDMIYLTSENDDQMWTWPNSFPWEREV